MFLQLNATDTGMDASSNVPTGTALYCAAYSSSTYTAGSTYSSSTHTISFRATARPTR